MKRKYKRKPTKLQKRALEIIREKPDEWKRGKKGTILKEAGYASKTAEKPKQNFTDRRGVAMATEEWREYLRGTGLGEQKLREKMAEWIDAKKIKSSLTGPDKVVEDYETQLKVKDDWRRDLGLPTEKTPIIAQQFNVGGDMSLEFVKDEGKT